MDENVLEVMADELFEPFADYAYDLSLDDALSLAEAMELRINNYIDGLRDDMRNRR